MADRIGVRVGVLRAIEDGRFDLLPPGIYARAAIRSYSSAVGLDPLEILDEIAPSLPAVEEPISAIGRLRGVRTAAVERPSPDQPTEHAAETGATGAPDWRLLIASFVDACVVGTLFAIVIACARIATAMPLAATGQSGARALAMMGVVFAVAYYLWFGGLMGSTAGEWSVGLGEAEHPKPGRTTLAVLGTRACRCVTADLRFVAAAGAWLAAVVIGSGRGERAGVTSAPEPRVSGLKLIRGVRSLRDRGQAAPIPSDDDLTIRMLPDENLPSRIEALDPDDDATVRMLPQEYLTSR